MTIIEVQSKTDAELKVIRKSMPKYLNDMTPSQVELTNTVYTEQSHRYDENKKQEADKFNKEVEAAGYKLGDKVQRFAPGLFGVSGEIYRGTIVKRSGIYMVKLDNKANTTIGVRKYVNLSLNWKIQEVAK